MDDDRILQEVLSLPRLKVFSCYWMSQRQFENYEPKITEKESNDLKQRHPQLKYVESIVLEDDKEHVTLFTCFRATGSYKILGVPVLNDGQF